MSNEEVPDDFADRVKRRILDAYGFESEAEPDAAIEKELPGYLAAEAEYKAERDAYLAELPDRVRQAQQAVTSHLRAAGLLPDGVEFETVPMDLQADARWMARGPIVVDYFTDRPPRQLDPDVSQVTEEQKLAAAEAANAQIEQWRERWGTVEDGGPSDEFLTDLAKPIRLEPRAIPLRDGREL